MSSQYEPRVIAPERRPLFGADWPNPPEPEPAEQLEESSKWIRPLHSSEAHAIRARALEGIASEISEASAHLLGLEEYLHAISDHSHDQDLERALRILAGIGEHYERDRG